MPRTIPLSAVLDSAHKCGGNEYCEAITFLVDWSESNSQLRNRPHSGVQTVWKYELSSRAGTPLFWAVYPHQKKIDLHFMRLIPFNTAPERDALRVRLKSMPGLKQGALPSETPTVLRLSALDTQETRVAFLDVLTWALNKVMGERK